VTRLLRRHRLRLTVAAVLAGLTVNAWIQAGGAALLVLVLASTAFVALVGFQFLFTGASAAHHALQTERAIKAVEADKARRKELSR
jgi:Tfp pilus assembly protein PilO